MKPGSTILIAGSRQGIGRALAEHYSRCGHSVVGFSRRDSDLRHERYRHICCDVTKEEALKSAFQQIAQLGSLEVLIYSAALYTPAHSLLLGTSQAEEMIRTNLLGAFLVTRHATRLMKRAGFGRVIYFSSMAVVLGSAGSAIYGATKAAVEQLAFSMSRDFATDNITFNTIGISTFKSAMLGQIAGKALAEAQSALVKGGSVELDELVAAVDYFGSDAARQITGQTLYFGGLR